MATTTHLVDATSIARTEPRLNPLILWHLLSLDAPTVAMLWTWFIAHANHIHLPATAVLAMGTAVWLLYAADRLLDSRLLDASLLNFEAEGSINVTHKPVILSEASRGMMQDAKSKDPDAPYPTDTARTFLPRKSSAPCIAPLSYAMSGMYAIHPATTPNTLEPRHHFHRLHQRTFRIGILLASCTLALLLPRLAPESIRLYLILGTLLVGYFVLIHVKTPPSAHRLPKELAVGVFFSAAVFIPSVARDPSLRSTLLPLAILLAILCSLNCLFIYKWEHPSPQTDAHPATNLALRFIIPIANTAIAIAMGLTLANHQLPRPIPAACALSTALLLLLHRNRHGLTPTTLRAAADLCLLTPLLFLPFN